MLPPHSKAGKKRALSESAVYPRAFGIAVAGLIGERGPVRPIDEKLDISYPVCTDDLRALDDLLIGPARTWWRKL